MSRNRRVRRPGSHTAAELELTLGRPASGGTCVAHADDPADDAVYFVRGGLPGERVVVRTTGSNRGGKVKFASVVAVRDPSADRVTPPCEVANTCGGCDFQHVALPVQRQWKAEVLRDQLRRVGKIEAVDGATLELAVQVAAVPLHAPMALDDGQSEPDSTYWRGWRSRVAVDLDKQGRVGFHAPRSSSVVAVGGCPVVVGQLQPLFAGQGQPGARVYASEADVPTMWPETGADAPEPLPLPAGWRKRTWVTREAIGRSFRVATDGFWQAHVRAPDLLAETVRELADLQAGESALDLYSGVGLFAAALATSTRPAAAVVAVEGDATAVRLARRNLHDLPSIRVIDADVRDYAFDFPVQVTVLDPPRAGAGTAVIEAIAAVTSRAIVHVGCDGANTARDLGRLVAMGWQLKVLRAFDLFPMTQHLETVAVLEPSTARPPV